MSRYIDADALLEELQMHADSLDEEALSDMADGVRDAMALIYEAPSIDIEPNRGEWISLHNGKWKCSECGIEVLIYAKGNFCPNCGADMRGTDDETEML